MIKAIILDVDGVIVGGQQGVNMPYPHPDVTNALRDVNISYPVSLISSKAFFPILKIIRDSELTGTHIVDGGAVKVESLGESVSPIKLISNDEARKIVSELSKKKIYVEVYSPHDWHIRKDAENKYPKVHREILQQDPVLKDDLDEFMKGIDITKMIAMVESDEDRVFIDKLLKEKDASMHWSSQPALDPAKLAIITPNGVSKHSGAMLISKSTGIDLANYLGVGDNYSDWDFMSLCGETAAPGNAKPELKQNVLGRNGYLGPSVDNNGIIDIFKHFELL